MGCCLVVALVSLGLGARSASADPISSEALGANVFTATSGGRLVPGNLSMASSSGLGVIRKELIQGTNADPVVSLAASAHLRVAPMLGLPNQLSPSAAARAMASYVTSFAQRYGPNGTFWSQNPALPYLPVQRYEIGNEPNMPLQWVADGTHLHWSDPAAYAQVYEAARTALHTVDPSAVAVVGGLADSAAGGVDVHSNEVWLAALPPGAVDAVGYHPYTFDVSDSLMSVDTQQLREWMDANGLGSVQLDINEFDSCQVTATTTTNPQACPANGQQSSETWGAAAASFAEWALCTPGLKVHSVVPFYWGDTPWADTDVWHTLTTTAGAKTPYGQQFLAEAHALTTLGCPPVNAAAPKLSGNAVAGQTLVGDPGTWSSSTSMTFTYQWERCDQAGAGCQSISGATSTSYQVQPGDVGATLVFSATARNQGGSTSATSPLSAIVTNPQAGGQAGVGGQASSTIQATGAGPGARQRPPGASTARLRRAILRASRLRVRRGLVTLTVRIGAAADLVGVIASHGRHRVVFRHERRRHRRNLASASRFDPTVTFAARLKPGRWTITVICVAATSSRASTPIVRTITIVG